jgi:hypothetical protein
MSSMVVHSQQIFTHAKLSLASSMSVTHLHVQIKWSAIALMGNPQIISPNFPSENMAMCVFVCEPIFGNFRICDLQTKFFAVGLNIPQIGLNCSNSHL